MAAHTFLVEPRSARNEETWNTLVAKRPSKYYATVSTVRHRVHGGGGGGGDSSASKRH